MKFNKDLLWIEQGPKLLLMGLEDNLVLVVTGPLKNELLDSLKQGLKIECSLPSDDLAAFKNLLSEANLLDESQEFKGEMKNSEPVSFGDGSQIDFIDLANKAEQDFKEYAVFAKYADPTSVVGRGGYDDDTAAPGPGPVPIC
jgi:hypothetical protein